MVQLVYGELCVMMKGGGKRNAKGMEIPHRVGR